MKLKKYEPKVAMPAYIPFNTKAMNNDAIKFDAAGYGRSDVDFGKRHPGMLSAEKAFESSVLKDQEGDSTLMPEIQSEFMRAGLGSTLDAFGDTGNVLTPGSAGEANVARNLGLSIAAFQDRNRQNRMQSLKLGEDIFPRRQFGLTGSDSAALSMMNNMGVNNWNQAWYGDQIQQGQFNYRVNAENQRAAQEHSNANAAAGAQKDASNKSTLITGGAALAGIAVIAIAL